MKIAMMLMFVLSLSCAAPSGPSEFHQGAYRPPARPPSHPVGAGAPTTGQRTEVHAPRGEVGRIIPQDEKTRRESGAWNSEQPRASDDQGPHRFIFGIGLPLIQGLGENDTAQRLVFRCAGMIEELIKRSGTAREWMSLTTNEQFCLAARLYEICAHATAAKVGEMNTVPEWKTRIESHTESAKSFRSNQCRDPHETDRVKDLATRLIEQWHSNISKDWKF